MSKTDEIRRLYGNIADLKNTNTDERKQMDRLVEYLKERVKVL